MKRYLLFAGDTYYPGGGWSDYKGSFDTIEEAKTSALAGERWSAEHIHKFDWWQVIASITETEVADG